MATPNVGILTNAGKNLIDRVNAGQTKITFSKIVFSSMNNNQLTDDQIKALTTVAPQEIVVNNPKVTLDNNTGETRIRATGNNEKLDDGVYVKTYGVFAKDDTGNEILYGLTVSPNPNYLPEYDGVTPQAVTYSYKVNISNTSNITFTNSNDIYVSDTDLSEALHPYAKTVDVNQQLDKKVTDNKDGTEQLNGVRVQPYNKLSDTIGGRNLIVAKTIENNTTLDGKGNTFGNSPSFTTDYIPVVANQKYTVTIYDTTISCISRFAYYDSSKNFISRETDRNISTSSSEVIVIPSGASYIKFSPDTPDGSGKYEDNYKLEQGSIATDWSPAPEDKVNVSDMRKPASDVAGIEEVNAKQDKIGYTPADDSKVVHSTDTSNWQKQKITNDDGTALVSIGDSDDLSSKLSSLSTGFFTFYYSANCANNPSTKAGRGLIEITYSDAKNGSDGNGIIFDEDNAAFVVTILNSKVTYFRLASLSGANNFDTVPTVNNNPLLLASSLPSDLARTGSDQEFTGKNTFDTAPIDKITGNPYITKDGVPSDVARTGQANTFTAAQTFSIAPTITDASKDKGDNQAATMADLKSLENSAWHQLKDKLEGTLLYKIDQSSKRIYMMYSLNYDDYINAGTTIADFSSIVKNIKTVSGGIYAEWTSSSNVSYQGAAADLSIGSPASIMLSSTSGRLDVYQDGHIGFSDGTYFTYDSLQ